MKRYHKNPRQITDRQFADLRRWLRELGDLSGVVHDEASDEIISGNQRCRAFDVDDCEIVITQEYDEPDEQGTTALGYVIWEGKPYNYRRVRWTAEQCQQANIVANRAGGSWDFDILANEFDLPDLLDWGFTERDFQLSDNRAEFTFLENMAAPPEADTDDGKKKREGPEGYPLAVVLQREELQRWQAWKERQGLREDRPAFLALLQQAGG